MANFLRNVQRTGCVDDFHQLTMTHRASGLTVRSALVGPPLEALRPIEPVELAPKPSVFTLAV